MSRVPSLAATPRCARVSVLRLVGSALAALMTSLCALPAVAADGADEGGPEDSPMWSPEAVRDFGEQTQWCEADESGQQASMRPRGSRLAVQIGKYVARPGDTLRAVAYRYFCSPSLLAAANKLPFDTGADFSLKAGQTYQVPIARGSPSGFSSGEQLTPGPGIQMTAHNMDRKWGRPQVVKLLRGVLTDVFRRWPQRHPAVVGSLSRAGGGRLGHHKSHRSGQDVDIGYYTYAASVKDWAKMRPGDLDVERNWYFLDNLERTGHVAAIFMAPSLQRRIYAYAASIGVPEARLRAMFQYGPKGRDPGSLIRNKTGHRDHMHIRLWVPEDMADVRAALGV